MELKYFADGFTFHNVKRIYINLALVHHPEKGGDYENMRAINMEYKSIFENLLFGLDTEPAQVRQEFFIFPIIISRIIILEGVHFEFLKKCLWLRGRTSKYYKALSELGFTFSKSNSKWFYSSVKKISAQICDQYELPL